MTHDTPPKRIWAWPNVTQTGVTAFGSGHFRAEPRRPLDDPGSFTGTEYILATPTALAAIPEVAALLREARAQGMDEALKAVNKARETVIHSANRNFIDGVAFGHDRSESAIRTAAAALRAGKGETP